MTDLLCKCFPWKWNDLKHDGNLLLYYRIKCIRKRDAKTAVVLISIWFFSHSEQHCACVLQHVMQKKPHNAYKVNKINKSREKGLIWCVFLLLSVCVHLFHSLRNYNNKFGSGLEEKTKKMHPNEYEYEEIIIVAKNFEQFMQMDQKRKTARKQREREHSK